MTDPSHTADDGARNEPRQTEDFPLESVPTEGVSRPVAQDEREADPDAQQAPRARRRRRPAQQDWQASGSQDDEGAVPEQSAIWLTSLSAQTLQRALEHGHLRAAPGGGYTRHSVEALTDALRSPDGPSRSVCEDLGLDPQALRPQSGVPVAPGELVGEYDPQIEYEHRQELLDERASAKAASHSAEHVQDESGSARTAAHGPQDAPEQGREPARREPARREPARRQDAALAGLRRSISALTGRIRRVAGGADSRHGGRRDGPPASERPSSGPARTHASSSADGAAAPSPEGLEQELRLSLRETSVGDYKSIAVASPKGGVGKSSLSYAVAGTIAYYSNLRVCLVDADPNFGAPRLLVPRPVEHSVVTLASREEEVKQFSTMREYVAQNELLRLDVLLGPPQAAQLTRLENLAEAYARIDEELRGFYDLVIYDLGLGFSHPLIEQVLGFSDEILLVGDGEVIPNAMLTDAMNYLAGLNIDVSNITLVINHRQSSTNESGDSADIRSEHSGSLRRVTEVFYDPEFSRNLNRRAFHIEDLSLKTRLGILTTATAALEPLRMDGPSRSFNHRKGA